MRKEEIFNPKISAQDTKQRKKIRYRQANKAIYWP